MGSVSIRTKKHIRRNHKTAVFIDWIKYEIFMAILHQSSSTILKHSLGLFSYKTNFRLSDLNNRKTTSDGIWPSSQDWCCQCSLSFAAKKINCKTLSFQRFQNEIFLWHCPHVARKEIIWRIMGEDKWFMARRYLIVREKWIKF